jgi:hypothetical protein
MVWTGGGGREGFGWSIRFGMPMSEGAGRLVSRTVLDWLAAVDMHEDVRHCSARLQRVQKIGGNHTVTAPERRLLAFITCDPWPMYIIILPTLMR